MTQLSLVDAAGALRDAEAKHSRLSLDLLNLQARVQSLEEEVMMARRELEASKGALYAAATADKVMIL